MKLDVLVTFYCYHAYLFKMNLRISAFSKNNNIVNNVIILVSCAMFVSFSEG